MECDKMLFHPSTKLLDNLDSGTMSRPRCNKLNFVCIGSTAQTYFVYLYCSDFVSVTLTQLFHVTPHCSSITNTIG